MYATSLFIISLVIVSSQKDGMDIFTIADWGGAELSPYTTPEQLASAAKMNELAATIPPKMIWAFGDNFYLKGVTDVNDHRFEDVWANVFNGDNIASIPFYVVAGNHDHYGNASAQVDYSVLNKSSRWIFPDFWYSFTWPIPNTQYTLQLVMIDTVLACGNVMDIDYCKYKGIADEDCYLHPKGPEDPKLADEQWTWIEEQLNSSTADFLIVAGHYPVWSIAEHGPTQCLVDQLRPLLISNRVTLLMTGHDHTFEYIQEDEYPDLGYIATGGTHECNPSTAHIDDIPAGSLKFHDCNMGGFTRVHIDSNGLFVDYYFGNDTRPYFKTKVFAPRTSNNQTYI